MTQLRISEAARLLGVSDDTVRRRVDSGALPSSVDESGRKVVDGAAIARLAVEFADGGIGELDADAGLRSARNHFTGLVTRVLSDQVMSQVELQCGPFRVVSLISTEAVRELALEPGSVATAVIKATNVSIETARGRS
ncbi:TOBE domain-containing protein [Nigerium sp.]|jgi:molybdopterin-binding protein|uniref:TOBE domain-containing protein n=1 Tax=Nigerium sp. TaxID=2042655 RepID=UPI003221A713